MLKVEGTEEFSGRIRVKLSSKPEVLGMQKAYHGSTIKVRELAATISISNLTVAALPRCEYVEGAPAAQVAGAPGLQQQ